VIRVVSANGVASYERAAIFWRLFARRCLEMDGNYPGWAMSMVNERKTARDPISRDMGERCLIALYNKTEAESASRMPNEEDLRSSTHGPPLLHIARPNRSRVPLEQCDSRRINGARRRV